MELLAAIILGALSLTRTDAIFGIGEPWKLNNLIAKHGIFPTRNNYFPLPKSTDDQILHDEYEMVTQGVKLKIPARLWCRVGDPRVCLLMDGAGNVVGIRISFLHDDTSSVEGFAHNGMTQTHLFGKQAYTFTVYFTNPEELTENGRVANGMIIDGVYAYIEGELVELPLADPKEKRYGHFVRQSCIPSMGNQT
ncbi:Hypothetical protein NTJ_15574 [Nesidiocoris tenuis]|uniref:Uncharacterized protein n=1 Tax=Nesidiocoris tenuis TaxID=355587 RepID=A0ABN7BEG2_9HEMI|nr:Hypothetical protein NTJ_15574 [Nesidiocoris tenuis]